jgi:hypothetical protein
MKKNTLDIELLIKLISPLVNKLTIEKEYWGFSQLLVLAYDFVEFDHSYIHVLTDFEEIFNPILNVISSKQLIREKRLRTVLGIQLLSNQSFLNSYFENAVLAEFQLKKITINQVVEEFSNLLEIIFYDFYQDSPYLNLPYYFESKLLSNEQKHPWLGVLNNSETIINEIINIAPVSSILATEQFVEFLEYILVVNPIDFFTRLTERVIQMQNTDQKVLYASLIANTIVETENSPPTFRSAVNQIGDYIDKIYFWTTTLESRWEEPKYVLYLKGYNEILPKLLRYFSVDQLYKKDPYLIIETIPDKEVLGKVPKLAENKFESKIKELVDSDRLIINELLLKNPNDIDFKHKEGHITRLHINFSPSLIPHSITKLECLKDITTTDSYSKGPGFSWDYDEFEFFESVTFSEIVKIPEFLKPYLYSDQILGWELWENEYNAIKSLGIADYGYIFYWNAMAADPEDIVQECVMMIRDGHLKYFRLNVETYEEFDEMEEKLKEFTELEEIWVENYDYDRGVPPWFMEFAKARNIKIDGEISFDPK